VLGTKPKKLRKPPVPEAVDAVSAAEGQRTNEVDRAPLVTDTVGVTIERHARKHVGVVWQGEQWTFVRGRLCATEMALVNINSIFVIGPVTQSSPPPCSRRWSSRACVVGRPDTPQLSDDVRLPTRGRPITL
jgi:hypothetical protein